MGFDAEHDSAVFKEENVFQVNTHTCVLSFTRMCMRLWYTQSIWSEV